MTRVYFVRHAQPQHDWKEDRSRPLTEQGKEDSKAVLEFLKDKQIDVFYSSPYKRSMDTIRSSAEFYGLPILTEERLRERQSGVHGNNNLMFRKRWADRSFYENGGESIQMVQERNLAALKEIVKQYADRNIVIGTHGTALSSILSFYDHSFDCDSFLRIIDWMPYIIELDFKGSELIRKTEHLHIEKPFQ